MRLLRLFVLLLSALFAAAERVTFFHNRGESPTTVVDLGYAKYKGVEGEEGVTLWLGLRYAAPPVGSLRFAAPQDPPKKKGITDAKKHGSRCIGTGRRIRKGASEDCLFLDVFGPSKATRSSKLPVYFFIHGGGFNAPANTNLDGTGLVKAADMEMIVVTFNYRLGIYGFLSGKQVKKDASLNNGLKDQLKALRWVKKHIHKFGGDPDHIVIGGHSAGGASATLLLTAYGAKKSYKNEELFHGVIAGSPSFATMLTVKETQPLYDTLVKRTDCEDDSEGSLTCLRQLKVEYLQRHSGKMPFPGAKAPPLFLYGPMIDGDLVPDYTYRLFHEGKFLKVPVVFGDDQNEGGVFAPKRTNTIKHSSTFLRNQFPFLKDSHLRKITSLFPKLSHKYPRKGAYWTQLCTVYGAMRYSCPKTSIVEAFTKFHKPDQVWSYRYAVTDPGYLASGLGTPHTAELVSIWGPKYVNNKPPKSYYTINAPIIPVVQAYWTSFIRTLDPNTHRQKGSPEWNTWNESNSDPTADGSRVLFLRTNVTEMAAMTQKFLKRCDYLSGIGVDIRQ